MRSFVYAFNYFVLSYFMVLNLTYIFLTLSAFVFIRRYEKLVKIVELRKLFQSTFFKPISVICPAFNEEATIAESVKSLLHLSYPEHEVIVVNDGSTDGTLRALREKYLLHETFRDFDTPLKSAPVHKVYESEDYPNLLVIDKENGGKADALNAGINIARYPLVCSVDADSILEPEALMRVSRPFLEDATTVAAGGVVRVANSCVVKAGTVLEVRIPKSRLAIFQIVEYLRAFLAGRIAWAVFGGLVIISGAFGLFKRQTVIECGGYRTDTVGEDMELVVRMHRILRKKKRKYKVAFIPDPICWTEVPEDRRVLARQRARWQRGLMGSIFMNWEMLFNPRFGVIGLVVMPYFLVFEMFGPVIEFIGYTVFAFSVAFGLVDINFVFLFFLVAVVLGTIHSIGSMALEEFSFYRYPGFGHLFRLIIYSVLENFGYRQLMSWWRLKGIVQYFAGNKSWGKMARKGFATRELKTGETKAEV